MSLFPLSKKTTIGLVGIYTTDDLPPTIISKISRGLTKVSKNGEILPDIASSWEIKNGGKTYIFHLNKNLRLSDGQLLKSKKISYAFKEVKVDRKDDYTIIYTLKDTYSPFLVTVSRPIFQNVFNGVGDYHLADIELNGNYIKSLRLVSNKDKFLSETYLFYPSDEALKYAMTLGETNKAIGLTSLSIRDTTFNTFSNLSVEKKVNYNKLVTLFYNTRDKILSDKKIRSGLSYALPEKFLYGERTYSSYSPFSIYTAHELYDKHQDFEHARLLLGIEASKKFPQTLTIKTMPKYMNTANNIAKSWKKVNVFVKIEEVESFPDNFQIYLGDFNLPKDPDQYVLWHSRSNQNITKLDSKRIDKLLEDGRRTINVEERKKIYDDFQKYIADEAPAAFLYFPTEYDIIKK